MSEERLSREKAFHDERFGGDDGERTVVEKYYSIMEKPRQLYHELALDICGGGQLLEYGCATGAESLLWLKSGASVTGIDISSAAIQKAQNNVRGTPYEARANYLEMNAEKMDFADATVDVVVGNGIIHHLDLDACYAELARVLKPDGGAVFMEPMGHNALINLYRRLTPRMRTEDEHPLLDQDIELAKQYFHEVEAVPFNFTSLLAVPFRSTPFFDRLVGALHSLDALLFKLPVFRRQAWFTVLKLSKPRK